MYLQNSKTVTWFIMGFSSIHTKFCSECVCVYHGQIFKDLDPIAWSHVSHVVEVGGVRDQLVPHLWISQHLSGKRLRTHKANTHTAPVEECVELFVFR